jgi:hypothetical protein
MYCFLDLLFQVLHATVIKQMQMAETLESVKESDHRVSTTILYSFNCKNSTFRISMQDTICSVILQRIMVLNLDPKDTYSVFDLSLCDMCSSMHFAFTLWFILAIEFVRH